VFNLRIRLPWWLDGQPEIAINGKAQEAIGEPSSYLNIKRTWQQDCLHIRLPKKLTAAPLPDRPDLVAFMDGPVVLAGILEQGGKDLLQEVTLSGDPKDPYSLLVPDNVREWASWRGDYRTRGQAQNLQFVPIYNVQDERYAVYFPITPRR
jgi:DUF1680 family protein